MATSLTLRFIFLLYLFPTLYPEEMCILDVQVCFLDAAEGCVLLFIHSVSLLFLLVEFSPLILREINDKRLLFFPLFSCFCCGCGGEITERMFPFYFDFAGLILFPMVFMVVVNLRLEFFF